MTLSFSENLYWLSEDRQTLKEVWTKAPATPAEKKKAVYILDEAFGIGGSAAKKLKLASGALASPSGTFTFSYERVVEGRHAGVLYHRLRQRYEHERTWDGSKDKNNPDLCDRGRRHRAVPDKRTFCHYARCRLRGILPLRSRESCWKAGDGQTLPVPCFPREQRSDFP